jgi:hypothetical protein
LFFFPPHDSVRWIGEDKMAGGTWDERTRARSLTGSSWSLLGESGRVVGVFGFAAALVPYLTSLGEVSFYQVWRELIWLAQVGLKNPENTSNELTLLHIRTSCLY